MSCTLKKRRKRKNNDRILQREWDPPSLEEEINHLNHVMDVINIVVVDRRKVKPAFLEQQMLQRFEKLKRK
jgi:hypothetical protein